MVAIDKSEKKKGVKNTPVGGWYIMTTQVLRIYRMGFMFALPPKYWPSSSVVLPDVLLMEFVTSALPDTIK